MSFEDINEENPKGYKPMELEYRDGHLWLPDGVRFDPDFPVGPERWQIDLFIEYERTFGRGRAFEMTHQTTEESRDQKILQRYGGYDLVREFEALGQNIPLITANAENKEHTAKYTKRIREFRKKYPLLYEDADEHQESGHPYS